MANLTNGTINLDGVTWQRFDVAITEVMTWRGLRTHVEDLLAAAGLTDASIWYIDVHFPTSSGRLQIAIADGWLSVES